MPDPATLDDYNAKANRHTKVSGYGAEVATHIPCPGCAAADWLRFPIAAALDGYTAVQEPSTCDECGRTFRLDIQANATTTVNQFVLLAGPDLPDYLPPIARDERGVR